MPIPQVEKKKNGTVRKTSSAKAPSRSGKSSSSATKHTASRAAHSGGKKRSTGNGGSRKTGGKSPASLKKRLLKWFLILCITGVVAGVLAVVGAYAWVSQDLASIEDVERRAIAESTKIYASDGTTQLYEIGDTHRTDVGIDQIAPELLEATVAIEDRRFYTHRGVDPVSLLRIIPTFIRPAAAHGGSTLTQQFIKNAILTNERTVTRKFKEAILAIRLEQKYSKDEILNMYLNEVDYGGINQGVESASQSYFGKPAAELTLAESATIASLPKAPSRMISDPDALQTRRNYTLDVMVEQGDITAEEAAVAKEQDTSLNTDTAGITEIRAPHFVFHVIDQLIETYGQTTVRKGGLRVITTLDWDKQEKAEAAVTNGIAKIEANGGSNASLVSINPHTGHIVAMVGSRDYFDEEHDGQVNVATSLRQPGSSFKPIVYLKGFEKGYTPQTKVFDVDTEFPTEAEGLYRPRNFDLSQAGPLELGRALPQSLNTPAVKILYLVGVDEALSHAESLGYTSLQDRSRFGLALVLGGAEVSLLEHTSTYATFAREGERRKPTAVLRVEDRDGHTLEEWNDSTEQVVDKQSVRTLNSVLSNRANQFPGLQLADRPVAAKTGTTQDNRDAWTMGYTPSLATGVWVGNNDNSQMGNNGLGLSLAAPIWREYMNAVLTGSPVENFLPSEHKTQNEYLGGNLESKETVLVDRITGEIIPEECRANYPEEFTEEREMTVVHSILHYIQKSDLSAGPPETPEQADPMYESWERAVTEWASADERKSEYLTDNTPRADCNQRNAGQQPEAAIISLRNNQEVTKKQFRLLVSVTPGNGRTINSIVYAIDGNVVDQYNGLTIDSERNHESSYDPSTLTNGSHTVSVSVTDDKGNTATESVNIDYSKK